jgi:hypothetical protein
MVQDGGQYWTIWSFGHGHQNDERGLNAAMPRVEATIVLGRTQENAWVVPQFTVLNSNCVDSVQPLPTPFLTGGVELVNLDEEENGGSSRSALARYLPVNRDGGLLAQGPLVKVC